MIINANAVVQHVIQIKNGIIKHVNVSLKIIVHCPASSTCICENGNYFKSIGGDLKIVCDEIINVMDIVSTKMTSTIAANATSTVSITSDDKKVKYKIDGNTLHTVLLVIILLLLIITIKWYHYASYRSKQKGIDALTM